MLFRSFCGVVGLPFLNYTKLLEEITDTFKISDLQKKYLHTVRIMSVDDQDFGSPLLQHWQIGGK